MLLFAISLMFGTIKVSAQEPYFIETNESQTSIVETYQEENYDSRNTRDVNKKKYVSMVVSSIIGGMIYDFYCYILETAADIVAYLNWCDENGYDPDDFEIVSKRVVYDNGCWQPEFPANPFCRALTAENPN